MIKRVIKVDVKTWAICKPRHWNLELELVLILQAPLFPVPLGLWTPNLAGWWFRMGGPHRQSHMILRYRGHMTNKKRYISVFTRPMHPKRSRVVT